MLINPNVQIFDFHNADFLFSIEDHMAFGERAIKIVICFIISCFLLCVYG